MSICALTDHARNDRPRSIPCRKILSSTVARITRKVQLFILDLSKFCVKKEMKSTLLGWGLKFNISHTYPLFSAECLIGSCSRLAQRFYCRQEGVWKHMEVIVQSLHHTAGIQNLLDPDSSPASSPEQVTFLQYKIAMKICTSGASKRELSRNETDVYF